MNWAPTPSLYHCHMIINLPFREAFFTDSLKLASVTQIWGQFQIERLWISLNSREVMCYIFFHFLYDEIRFRLICKMGWASMTSLPFQKERCQFTFQVHNENLRHNFLICFSHKTNEVEGQFLYHPRSILHLTLSNTLCEHTLFIADTLLYETIRRLGGCFCCALWKIGLLTQYNPRN